MTPQGFCVEPLEGWSYLTIQCNEEDWEKTSLMVVVSKGENV